MPKAQISGEILALLKQLRGRALDRGTRLLDTSPQTAAYLSPKGFLDFTNTTNPVTLADPNWFLQAATGKDDRNLLERSNRLLPQIQDDGLNQIPRIYLSLAEQPNTAGVAAHEGRARSRALQELGVSTPIKFPTTISGLGRTGILRSNENSELTQALLTGDDSTVKRLRKSIMQSDSVQPEDKFLYDENWLKDLDMPETFDEGGKVQKHSSSPGSPGVGGAIHDALAALRDYLVGSTGRQIGVDRQKNIENAAGLGDTPPAQQQPQSQAQGGEVDHVGHALSRMGCGMAEGGEVEQPPDQDSSLVHMKDYLQRHLGDLAARAGTSFARQFYGLDKNGHVVLGGRAWTKDQGGTPMGLLDNITAIPHHVIALANLINKLQGPPPADVLEAEGGVDKDIPSPQWSDEADQRSEALRHSADAALNFPKAHTLAQHIADNADVVTPIPGLQGEGAASHLMGLLGGSSLRNLPRMTAEFAGANGALDTLLDRLDQKKPVHHEPADPEFEQAALDYTNSPVGFQYGEGGEVGIAERLAALIKKYLTEAPTDSGARDAGIMKDFQSNPVEPVAKHPVYAGIGLSDADYNALLGADAQPVHSDNISKILGGQ